MTLRLLGTLARWNDDRGFGFIAPHSGDHVFVHLARPAIGHRDFQHMP